jgi:DNA-binding IclR family transcriptional regulator
MRGVVGDSAALPVAALGLEVNLKQTAETPLTGGVEAVDRALSILGAFDVGFERQSLSELAARTGFYKSTILRLCQSLERAGFLHREESGAFVLGVEPLRLAAIYRRGSKLETHIRPALRTLVEATGESASFYQRQGNRRQCVYREETRRAIRDHIMEGDMLALNVGAAGHVLTTFGNASLSPAERARRYGQMPLASFGERDPETAAVAAPVFSHDGLAGALGISGPRTRLTPKRVAEVGPIVLEQAETLSKLMGGTLPEAAEESSQKRRRKA